ncbi:MAG: hypothetical protein P8L87_05725, partial [Gammaproteobacteria bacterium]|nr:hypothetical protein [Gammaproteobacteria bacterium]
YHENKRFVIQEVIEENICNPVHASFKPHSNGEDFSLFGLRTPKTCPKPILAPRDTIPTPSPTTINIKIGRYNSSIFQIAPIANLTFVQLQLL